MAFGIVKIVHWVICGRVGLNINAKDEERMLLVFCGQRWIRTTEVERQQIYSLPHLATLEFALTLSLFQKTHLRQLHNEMRILFI